MRYKINITLLGNDKICTFIEARNKEMALFRFKREIEDYVKKNHFYLVSPNKYINPKHIVSFY